MTDVHVAADDHSCVVLAKVAFVVGIATLQWRWRCRCCQYSCCRRWRGCEEDKNDGD